MGKHGGKAPIPLLGIIKRAAQLAERWRAYSLWQILLFFRSGHCPPQERHALCEHLLSDERAFSAACRMNKLHYPAIRVQRRVRGRFWHSGAIFTFWQVDLRLRERQ